jgi:hypothetical protein
LGANNISSGTIRASTLISTANLSTNNLTATNLLATNQTTTNIIVTNLTSSIIQATGITTGTIRVTGNADLSTGLTTVTDLTGTNQTTTNIIVTNLTSSIIQATGITTGTIRVTGNADLSTGLTTVTDLTGTNITSGTIRASTLISTANLGANNISSGTIRASTLISTANLSTNNLTATNLLATASTITNLSIPGTLTVVNITSTNLVDTNISAATILVSGGTLNATFNSNTIGSIFTTGGNVGIGNTTPNALLHVTGNAGTDVGIFNTLQGSGSIAFRPNATAGNVIRYGGSGTGNNILRFLGVSDTEYMRIDTGNVGIGTTSPSNTLDVSGTARITTSLTTGALYSTNQTTTNIVTTNITASSIIVTGGSLNATFNSNTIGNIFTTGGSIGIGTTSPSASLHINTTNTFGHLYSGNVLQNRRIVLWNMNNNIHQFVGFGVNSNTLRYQVETTAANHIFYAASSTTNSDELMRITGVGNVVISGSTSTTSVSSGSLYSTNQTTTNIVSTAISSGNVIVNNNLNISGISSFFGGSFSANNNVTSASTVTGLLFPSATVRSFIATLNINISKPSGNLNSTVTLEGTQLDSGWILYDSALGDSTGLVFTINSSGQILYTSPNYIGWVSTTIRFEAHYYTLAGTYTPVTLPTSGNVSVTGVLSVNDTSNATSTSSGALTVSGGAGISKSLLVGENLNVGGLSNTFTGSFAAANNVAAATNVTGFLVPTATFSSFTANVNVRLLTTLTTLNAQYMFEATQSTGGWLLNDTSFGDSVGITFTITSTGQIQYTSTNVANWQSTTINFAVNAISISSGFTAVLPSSGNVSISGNLTIDSTTDSSSTSSASLVLAGGAGINKSLLLGGNFNIGGVSTQFAGTFSAANGASGASIPALSFPNANIRSFTCTISLRVVSSVNYNTQHTIDGIQRATGGWQISDSQIGDTSGITFAINSSGQLTYTSPTFTSWTSTTMHYNAVAYNISSSYTPMPMPTEGSATIAGPVVIQSTNIASSTSSGALSVSGGVGIQNNLIVANNFFVTSAGNVGIGTSSPNYTLDINGTLEASNSNGLMLFASTGNVGIGTTSPGARLHVSGACYMGGSVPTTTVSWGNITLTPLPGYETADIGFNTTIGVRHSISGLGGLLMSISTPGYIRFITGNVQNMVINTNGNVGIGIQSPNHKLEVSGAISQFSDAASNYNGYLKTNNSGQASTTLLNPGILLYSLNSTFNYGMDLGSTATGRFRTRIFAPQTADIAFSFASTAGSTSQSGFTDRVVVTGDGNVGIGTTSPIYSLDVTGTLEASNSNGLMLFASSGNLGIGTTTPSNKLDIVGSIRAMTGTSSSILINTDGAAGWGNFEMFGTNGAYIDFKNASGDDYDARIKNVGSNNSLGFYMNAAETTGMSLTSAGTLLISGDIGAFATISDRTLKTNITDISPNTALETVKTLRPVTFNWKDDIFNAARRGEFDSGFIAQEVEEVIPHAVGTYDTIDHQNTYKNMRHERIIPYLVGSIQKLESIIVELKERIGFLESK